MNIQKKMNNNLLLNMQFQVKLNDNFKRYFNLFYNTIFTLL